METYFNNKVDNRINNLINNRGDTFLKNIELLKDISDKLLPYQHLHVTNLLTTLDLNNVVLDCSDTGTGKTYVAIAICKQKKLIPFIICPKAAISTWLVVLAHFNVTTFEVINYEAVMKKYPNWNTIKQNVMFIFDEVHKCKNKATENATILMSTKFLKNKKILLSATLVDKIGDFSVFGYMLGFYNNVAKGPKWVKDISTRYNQSLNKVNPLKDMVFPYKGAKMSIREIKDFPTSKIILHRIVGDENADITPITIANVITIRKKLELLKVDIFVELTVDNLENGLSVVIFVNFLDTLTKLVTMLNKKKIKSTILHGTLSDEERELNIKNFQNNQINVIICTFGVGGAAISLHDLHGRARISIVSLPESNIVFNQSIGRICRAGSKSCSIHMVPIFYKTYEKVIYDRIKKKVLDLNQLSCDDFNETDLNFYPDA
jgi:SNF2 family DNA or RNA helicase